MNMKSPDQWSIDTRSMNRQRWIYIFLVPPVLFIGLIFTFVLSGDTNKTFLHGTPTWALGLSMLWLLVSAGSILFGMSLRSKPIVGSRDLIIMSKYPVPFAISSKCVAQVVVSPVARRRVAPHLVLINGCRVRVPGVTDFVRFSRNRSLEFDSKALSKMKAPHSTRVVKELNAHIAPKKSRRTTEVSDCPSIMTSEETPSGNAISSVLSPTAKRYFLNQTWGFVLVVPYGIYLIARHRIWGWFLLGMEGFSAPFFLRLWRRSRSRNGPQLILDVSQIAVRDVTGNRWRILTREAIVACYSPALVSSGQKRLTRRFTGPRAEGQNNRHTIDLTDSRGQTISIGLKDVDLSARDSLGKFFSSLNCDTSDAIELLRSLD